MQNQERVMDESIRQGLMKHDKVVADVSVDSVFYRMIIDIDAEVVVVNDVVDVQL